MVEHIVVKVPDGDDLEFEGELVVDEHDHKIGFVKVWKTDGGTYVLKQNRSVRPGIRTIHRVELFDTVESLSETLGDSPGAKAVVRKLGLSRTVRIK